MIERALDDSKKAQDRSLGSSPNSPSLLSDSLYPASLCCNDSVGLWHPTHHSPTAKAK